MAKSKVSSLNLHLLKIIILLARSVSEIRSANHYCVNGQTLSIELDDFYHRDETIVPEVPDETPQQKLEAKACKWAITLTSARTDLQVVLAGAVSSQRILDEKRDEEKPGLLMHLGSSVTRVSAGLFKVQALENLVLMFVVRKNKRLSRGHFSIEANWDPRVQTIDSSNLRVVIPLPGSCSRDMLSFRHNCYYVSRSEENVSSAMSSLRGAAQLASFSSMAEIAEFVATNNARLNEYPYSRPLSLSQQVRLGIFHRRADDTLLNIFRNGSCWVLRPILNSDHFLLPDEARGPCASLRVTDAGAVVFSFDDCTRPMLRAAQCSSGELTPQVLQLMETRLISTTLSNDEADPLTATSTQRVLAEPTAKVWVIVVASVAGFIFLVLLVNRLVFLCRHTQLKEFSKHREELIWPNQQTNTTQN